MRLYDFMAKVENKDSLTTYQDFLDFTRNYLDFVGLGRDRHPNIQADIISEKESNYHFIQYKDDGSYCVTRPINTDIFVFADDFDDASREFIYSLNHIRDIESDQQARDNINRIIYTCQQCVGCTLDAFNNPNKARKRNGTLFEVLIRDVIRSVGVTCDSGDEYVAISDDDQMKFQHDAIIKRSDQTIAGIGQLKTSSKDRIDKIFLDKWMYNSIKDVGIPHFAIFLNDVQRASNRRDGNYCISSTFLPGHFKAYTMALIPLDGVYYFDLRPNMQEDEYLSRRIYKFDKFLVEDMWRLIES
ncbi:MAG: hypothetical protein IJ794_10990 [Lachnospiraceae bacterium]|nr:hypothetical protein [Lachnospiraceae bacterium]